MKDINIERTKENIHIMTYDEFIESRKDNKYRDGKLHCIACGAAEAYWEIGDVRYPCPGCEKCANLVDDYGRYVKMQKKVIEHG